MSANFILLAVLTVAVVVALVFLVRLIHQLTRVAEQIEATVRNLNDLTPRIESVLESAERELVQIQSISARLDRMVAGVEHFGQSMSAATAPLVDAVASLVGPFRFVKALVTGVQTGLLFLGKIRGGKRSQDEEDEYMEANYGRRTPL